MTDDEQTRTFDCGIAHARLESWLDGELQLARRGDGSWVFQHGGAACEVSLAPLGNRALGAVAIERTQLSIAGNPEALDVFMRLFTLRFISAGG